MCQPPQIQLNIACEEIAFDGNTFAWKPVLLSIPVFGGNLPVVDLPHYPLSFHDDPEGMKERLTIRAKKALEYQELTYCEYSGVALKPTPCGVERHNVSNLLHSQIALTKIRIFRLLGESSSIVLVIRNTKKGSRGKEIPHSLEDVILVLLSNLNLLRRLRRNLCT
jgi:hypothetical protein